MIWDIYLSDPTFLIGPTLGAVASCVLGYYAALRNRWRTSFVLLVALLIPLSMLVVWVCGVETMEYKSQMLVHAFGVSAPAVLPFVVSAIYMDESRKASALMLLTLEVAAGLLGVLLYPILITVYVSLKLVLGFP
jgi:hypothetical protein